jgi:integrase
MSTNSQIRIPKSSQTKGLYVLCNSCGSKSKTVLPKKPGCTHPTDKIVLKALIYVPGSKDVRSRVLKARNYKDAIIEKIQFEKQLKANNYINSPLAKPRNHSLLLMPSIAEYLQYLNNTNVYEHQKKNLSEDYKKQIRRYLDRFVDSLIEEKVFLKTLSLDQIDNRHVSMFHNYLVKSKLANRTYNRHMDTVSEFFNYFINNKGVPTRNYFSSTNVQRKRIVSQNKSVPIKDFKRLLTLVTEENGVQVLSTGEKKYHYYSWLKDAFELGLLSGGRRDEIMFMKFSDIIETRWKS